MLAGILSWLAFGRLVAFPPAPLPGEVVRGAQLYEQHKGIDRTVQEDRAVVGLWFDGRIKRDIEFVLWLSPGYVSRRLGYLQAKEKWSSQELQRRWRLTAEALDGKITFVVQLAAFPTVPLLDDECESSADPREVTDVRFLLTSGPGLPEAPSGLGLNLPPPRRSAIYPKWAEPMPGGPLRAEPRAVPVAMRQVRDRKLIEEFNWLAELPFGRPLQGEFDQGSVSPLLAAGPYHAAWYLVSADLTEIQLHPCGFELRIFSPRKERIAHFRLLPTP